MLSCAASLSLWYLYLKWAFTSFYIARQEFKEGRRNYQQAPQVLFSHRDPPAELEGTDARTGENIGYITFGKSYNISVYHLILPFVVLFLKINGGIREVTEIHIGSNF